ncbi:hypothetical protein A3L09_09700 [Thermococcus profundus]|uniref:Uncharacterized protein n=1 Tax=Thermococcus profundus TaxID=49899 RepID=A0A2Z2MDZ0_THEPR|nr:hypothetical protein A3L09_09700 [Thermococcus profundus]
MSVDKGKAIKVMLAVFIGIAALFGTYSVAAYRTSPSTTRVEYKTSYVERGELTHMGFFSNESVYQNGTSLSYYPGKITRIITGNYMYATTPGAEGKYKAVLRTDYYVTSNKKRIYITNTTRESWSGEFSGSFSIPVTFDVGELENDLKEVQGGTGLYRASGDTYLMVEVNVPGREPFTQKVSLTTDTSGMLRFSNPAKDYKKVERHTNTTINKMDFAGREMTVSEGRTLFPAMALLFLVPPLGFAYTRREKKPGDEMKGLRKFIVDGVPSEVGSIDPVTLESAGDLGKVFDLVDKPIVHYVEGDQDVYAIVDGGVIYEYREVSRRGKKKAN